MSRNISGIFVVPHLAVLESSPRAANYLFVLFPSFLLRGVNSCTVSVDLCRGSSECEKLFYGFVHGKKVGEHSQVTYLSNYLTSRPTWPFWWRAVPYVFYCLYEIKFAVIIDYLRYFTLSTIHICVNKSVVFLISNFRRVQYVVCFLLGNSPASEFYMPMFHY
jgi:hypothetical protein